jgi:hypothetical protein
MGFMLTLFTAVTIFTTAHADSKDVCPNSKGICTIYYVDNHTPHINNGLVFALNGRPIKGYPCESLCDEVFKDAKADVDKAVNAGVCIYLPQ